MPDWKSRLVVKFKESGAFKTITPIDSFQPSFAMNAEPLHSIEDTHIGVIYSPENLSFTMTVKALGTAAAELTALALSGGRFEVQLEEKDGESHWSFSKVVLKDCVITSATPSSATPSGAPTATFSGFSLSGSATPRPSA